MLAGENSHFLYVSTDPFTERLKYFDVLCLAVFVSFFFFFPESHNVSVYLKLELQKRINSSIAPHFGACIRESGFACVTLREAQALVKLPFSPIS